MAGTLFLALAAGCIPLSLQPIYTPDVLCWEPRLLGSWGEGSGDGTVWTFSVENELEKAYRLTAVDGDEKASYIAHLIQLGDTWFLDLFVEKYPGLSENPDLLGMQLVPVHSFFKLNFGQNELRFHMLNPEWLQDKIEEKRLTIPYQSIEALDDWPVFTASPKRMQRFLRKWAHVEEAWKSDSALSRIESGATASAVAPNA